jgi:hypothetical protein
MRAKTKHSVLKCSLRWKGLSKGCMRRHSRQAFAGS